MAVEGDKNRKPVPESKKPAPETKKTDDGKKPAVPETKSQTPPETPILAEEAQPGDEPSAGEPSLGKIIASARERRSLSQDTAARDAHIPPHYVRMIESDDYSSIADQLYLLPFLRRYATFVGLDPEEVASRFVRDVQRADMNATRMSEPIQMVDTRDNPTLSIVIIAVIAIVVIALGWFGYRRFYHPRKIASAASRSVRVVPASPLRS